MSVRRAQQEISAAEFVEWMRYYEMNPWGEERADWRAAMIAATVANRHRNPKREPKQYQPKDFLPEFGPQSRKQTPAQMQAVLRIATAAIQQAQAQQRKES